MLKVSTLIPASSKVDTAQISSYLSQHPHYNPLLPPSAGPVSQSERGRPKYTAAASPIPPPPKKKNPPNVGWWWGVDNDTGKEEGEEGLVGS